MATCRLHKIRPIGRQVPPLLVRLSLELVPGRVQLPAGDQEGTHAYISIYLYFYAPMYLFPFFYILCFNVSRFLSFYANTLWYFYASMILFFHVSFPCLCISGNRNIGFICHKIIAWKFMCIGNPVLPHEEPAGKYETQVGPPNVQYCVDRPYPPPATFDLSDVIRELHTVYVHTRIYWVLRNN